MARVMMLLTALLIATYAIAQETVEVGLNPALWFSDPRIGTAAVIGLVEWLRRKWPQIDGPIVVPLVAILSGVLVGSAWGMFGQGLIEPFSSFASSTLGGAMYGLACAVTAVLGVNFFELLTSKLGKALTGILGGGGDASVDPDPGLTAAGDARLGR